MLFPQLKDKVLNFWTLQITGWSLYWVHILTIASLEYSLYNFKLIVWTLLTQLIGFFTTCLLRLFYKKIEYRKIKLIKLAAQVLMASVAAQNIWFWTDKLLDVFMAEKSMPAIPLTYQEYFRSGFYDLLLILTWSILYFVIKIWKEWESQRRTTSGLMIEAQAAQLQMLRSQLNPHFLFNSLASIRALIDEDENNARNMVSDLSAFLRYSLVERNDSITTLENEINAIKYYLSIEKRRYEEKLEVEYFIEEGCEHFALPSYLLLPLVENAIKYGMQTSSLPLKIQITALNRDKTIELEVRNSGKIINYGTTISTRTGLKNIKQRLEQVDPMHCFKLFELDGYVFAVIIINKKPVLQ